MEFIPSFLKIVSIVKEIVDLHAKNIMCRKVIFTRPDTPIMRALSRMYVRNVRQLPVLDTKQDVIVGMVSKGDVFDALFHKHLTSSQHEKKKTKKQVKKTKK